MALSLVARPNSSCHLRSIESCGPNGGADLLKPINTAYSSWLLARPATYSPSPSAVTATRCSSHPSYPSSWTDHLTRILMSESFEMRKRPTRYLNPRATSNSPSSESATGSETLQQPVEGLSAQSHMDLLERFTSESSSSSTTGKTIAQQLAAELQVKDSEDITVPLGSGQVEMEPLTISQRRNIRRQNYLNEVAKRNDGPFFTAVALFVILPPAVILGVAVATGYIDLFP